MWPCSLVCICTYVWVGSCNVFMYQSIIVSLLNIHSYESYTSQADAKTCTRTQTRVYTHTHTHTPHPSHRLYIIQIPLLTTYTNWIPQMCAFPHTTHLPMYHMCMHNCRDLCSSAVFNCLWIAHFGMEVMYQWVCITAHTHGMSLLLLLARVEATFNVCW